MNDKSNMGKAFAKAFKDYTIEPSPQVWEKVSSSIPQAPKGFFSGKTLVYSAVALVAAATVLVLVLVNKQPDNKEVNNVPETIIPKQAKPVPSLVKSDSTNITATSEQREKDVVTNVKPDESTKRVKPVKHEKKAVSLTNEKIVEKQKDEKKADAGKDSKRELAATPQTKKDDIEIVAQEQKVADEPENQSATQSDTTIKFGADPVICFGEDARLEVFGGESYRWSNGSVMSYAVVQPVSNSDYTVTVTDKYGSKHIHKFHVGIDRECTSVFVPSAFTPNGDGNNDIFKVYGENISDFSITIMNRQGQLLYSSKDINSGWDGTWHGELQAPQVYVYTVTYKNGRGERKILKGQFTLVK